MNPEKSLIEKWKEQLDIHVINLETFVLGIEQDLEKLFDEEIKLWENEQHPPFISDVRRQEAKDIRSKILGDKK